MVRLDEGPQRPLVKGVATSLWCVRRWGLLEAVRLLGSVPLEGL
jgi:hypothetical protein